MLTSKEWFKVLLAGQHTRTVLISETVKTSSLSGKASRLSPRVRKPELLMIFMTFPLILARPTPPSLSCIQTEENMVEFILKARALTLLAGVCYFRTLKSM